MNLEKYTYDYLLQQALSYVSDDVDKREGSIIYDTLSPFCLILAETFLELKNIVEDNFITTAIESKLDLLVEEQGLVRKKATKAIVLGFFEDENNGPMQIRIGTRFSSISGDILNYVIIEKYEIEGYYRLECEVPGAIGNNYAGDILPIDNITGLTKAIITEILITGEDAENDVELRKRYFETITTPSFGGNIADYRKKILEIKGVGDVKIFPTPDNVPGLVACVIIDSEYDKASDALIELVQTTLEATAPVGHDITVRTVVEKEIDIELQIEKKEDYPLEHLIIDIKSKIEVYFKTLIFNDRYVRSAKIQSLIIDTEGVIDIMEHNIENIILADTYTNFEVPILKNLSINGES